MIGLAVRRPVATLTVTGALVALGVPSLLRLPLERLPDVTLPELDVTATWPGASPETVEALVTAPIEAVAQQVRGVESVASTSYPERARVEIAFTRGTDMEFARLELAERLAAMARSFPPGADRPVVSEHVPEAFAAETEALMVHTLAGPALPGALRETAREVVRPALLEVEGVDRVEIFGGAPREVRVRLDPDRLAARGLAPTDVRRAIGTGLHVAEPGARIRRGERELTVAVDDRATSIADVEALVVEHAGGATPAVRLADLGDVALAWSEPRGLHRVDGQPAVSLYVYRASDSNAIRVADRVRGQVAALGAALPPGHRLIEELDGTERIRAELADLRNRALLSAAIVLVVLLVAFRRWRPALLAFGTIAVTILVALDVLWLAGLSLNLLTLAGLAMGFGLVVDNAIVVLEAIETRRARGETPRAAAVAGPRSVALPLLAATATTLVVFVPFVWLQGELRAYYVPFAITVAVVLAASLAVSLTAVPAIAARISGRDAARREARVPSAPVRVYRHVIGATLARPAPMVVAAFLLLAGSGWLFLNHVPRGPEWAAWDDRTFLVVRITLPPGGELERTDAIARTVEAELATVPEIDGFTTRVRSESAIIRIDFPDSLESMWVPVATKERLVAFGHRFGGAEVRVYGFGPAFYGGGGGAPTYSLKLLGYDYERLATYARVLAGRLEAFTRIRDVDPNASGLWYERDVETELVLAPDRARLAGYGIAVEELLDRATAATRGRVGRDVVVLAGEEVDLDVKLAGARQADVDALAATIVTTDAGRPIRVGDVADIRPRGTLGRIVREDQQYQRIVAWEFRGPRKLGDRVRDAVLASTELPPGYAIEAERSWWETGEEETRQIAFVVALAIAFVFLVTAALFESLRAPLVVLAAVPLAMIGVFLMWFYSGRSFGCEAWIGVIMMAGIVVNNAILVVDRIGALRRGADGPPRPLREAALEGTLDRVRPILMTTTTTVLGLLPLVVLVGEDAATLWSALALATIGGLVASTALVLVTIPALYVLVGRCDRPAGRPQGGRVKRLLR